MGDGAHGETLGVSATTREPAKAVSSADLPRHRRRFRNLGPTLECRIEPPFALRTLAELLALRMGIGHEMDISQRGRGRR